MIIKNLILCSILIGTAVCHGANVTEWRGPGRTGIYDEKNLLKEWPAEGPKLLWSIEDLGEGYASVIIVDGKIYTTGNGTGENEGKELLYAMDMQGKQLWSVVIGSIYPGNQYRPSRSTPTFADGKLYVVSGGGDAACVSLDGKVEWTVNVPEELGGQVGRWGWSVSPLVMDDKVIFTIASKDGVMVALDTKTGKKIWLSGALSGAAGYVSPKLVEKNGKKQVLGMNEQFIFGVDPTTGKIEWSDATQEQFKTFEGGGGTRHNIHCVTPILVDDMVVSSTGYEVGSYGFKVNDTLTEGKLAWMNRDIDVHHGGIIVADGAMWGTGTRNLFGALDVKTGKAFATEAWGGKGASIIAADGMIYAYSEKGDMALFEMNKEKIVKKGEFPITKGTQQHWAHPVISDGILYVRRGNALMAYDVRTK